MPYGYMNQLPPGRPRKQRFSNNRYVKFLHKFDALFVWSLMIIGSWALFVVIFCLIFQE